MKTTKQLSNAYVALQEEAMEKIKSFFKKRTIIKVQQEQHLTVHVGTNVARIVELFSDGRFMYFLNKRKRLYLYQPNFEGHLSVDALLTILDELERMKKEGTLDSK